MKSKVASFGARALDRLRWLSGLYVALVAVGLGFAASRSGVVQVDAWPAQPSTSTKRNLAHLSAGTRLSVSSFDAASTRNHPLYLIDGDLGPPLYFKTEPRDRKPWLRFQFARRANIETIQLVHVPKAKRAMPSSYTVRCLKSGQGHSETVNTQRVVSDRWDSLATPLRCAGVDEVMLHFELAVDDDADRVELYEVILMGSEA